MTRGPPPPAATAEALFQQSRNSHADWPRMGSLTNTFGRAPSDLFDVTPDGPGEFE
jgi:hypothetical protein